MANPILTKRALIDKANTTVVTVVGIAAFVFVFSMVATKTLIGQASYQNRIISAKRTAVDQLKADIASTAQLKTSYNAFISTNQNALGGNPNGTGPQDGNNAKIVLDALPSSYDFPALTTSLERLLASQKVNITSISGTDDEVAQGSNQSSSSPQPIAIPFQLSVKGDYAGIQNVVSGFERSIRPIQLQTIDLSGRQGSLALNITAQTYFQPAKSLNIKKEVVK
jgi:Tfp pilus assembly protein PilO